MILSRIRATWARVSTVFDLHATRRRNLLAEFQRFAGRALADGQRHTGLEESFAKAMGIQASQFSSLKSGRLAIGNRLARRFEDRLQRQAGWLDEQHPSDEMTPEESARVAQILALYRRMDFAERRQLRQFLVSNAPNPDHSGTEN